MPHEGTELVIERNCFVAVVLPVSALITFVAEPYNMSAAAIELGTVGVDAIQFVPSLIMNLPVVAEAFGNVGVLHTGVVLAPLNRILFAVAVPAKIAPV